MSDTNRILAEVHLERLRQDAKWGVQSHSTYFPGMDTASAEGYLHKANLLKNINDLTVDELNRRGYSKDQNCTWDTILREEVYEALAETDPKKRRVELVQVCAVAVAMIEQIDRELASGGTSEGQRQ